MSRRLFVGNLPFDTSEDELRQVVAPYAEVYAVHLPLDRETRRPRGFGFVEVPDEVAPAVIAALNGTLLAGRPLVVNDARAREERTAAPRPPGFGPRADSRGRYSG